MPTIATLKDILHTLIFPWLFMSISARQIPTTIRTLIREGKYASLLSLDELRDALFGHFWAIVGPDVKMNAEVRVIPLLEGRVTKGQVRDDVMGRPVEGRILEIGAGSGMWADVFLKINTAGAGITKIYGVEPHPQSVAALRERVKKLGMEDIYEAIPVGIEQLDDPVATAGTTTIEPESIDCIVSVLCLCSIADQEENIRALYRLLKPGGRWYVYEHVRVRKERGGVVLGMYQRFTNFFWSFFVGSCRLCNETEKHLRDAGKWSDVDLVQPPDEPAHKLLPHIFGVLTK